MTGVDKEVGEMESFDETENASILVPFYPLSLF